MNRNAALLGAGLLAIAASAVLLLSLREGRSGRELERAPRNASGDAGESQLAWSGERVARDVAEMREGADANSAEAPLPPTAEGVLRLEFTSALDGSPVADLPFVVYRERGGNKELASGRSDERGRAEVRDLEENVILVRTARRPPFASRVEACWLARAETKELIVRLDGGARVTGRVVDDEQRPIAGAEILVADDSAQLDPPNPLDRTEPSAVTGPDGRFAVDHVAVRPSGVWIVDGKARPEQWDPAHLHARKDVALAFVTANVRPESTLDVGDVLLERSRLLGGVVLDPERRPLPGALVTWRHERRSLRRSGHDPFGFAILPGQDGFRMHAGETVTDASGRFELPASRRDASLAVWAPWGQRQVFGIPDVPPGERRDDLVLELRAITMLEVELRDARGERVTGPGPAARGNAFQPIALQRRRGWGPRAVAVVRLDDRTKEQVTTSADKDGIFRYELESPPARMRELTIDLSGYETVRDSIAGRIEPTTRLSYVVEEIPGLRVRVRRTPGEPVAIEKAPLSLQICLASPAQRQDSQERSCCGLGAYLSFEWNGEPREFVFPASEPRAYWAYLSGRNEEQIAIDLASFGPFHAGPEIHEIEIDPALLSGLSKKPEEEPRPPPEETQPGEPRPHSFLTLRVVDAATQEPIAGAQLHGDFMHLTTGEDGRIDRAELPPGRWTVSVIATGHRRVEIPDLVLVEDEARDLGTIALEPIPSFSGRIVQADGSPPSRRGFVRARVEGSPTVETDGDGRFRLHADVPDRVHVEVMHAFPAPDEDGIGMQRFLVEGWTSDVERELRLAPWQSVDIRIGGPATELPGTSLSVWACPAPDEPQGMCDHRAVLSGDHTPLLYGREIEPLPGRRVFRFRMAAGRYQVYGRDLLHDVPVESIEVGESSDVQVFELSSR